MVNQQDRKRLLDEVLARAIPESREWARGLSPSDIGEFQYWVEVRSPARPTAQHLNILLRHDGDIQVEYYIAEKSGSPFELLFVPEAGKEEEAIKQASRFVADLLAERLVLVYSKGVFGGGRRFLIPALVEANRRHLKWSTSWLGTYDWQL
jgi:hypothetical protein